MSAADAIAGWAHELAELATLPERLGAAAAPGVEAAARATAGAGTTPDGAPWPPRQDGGRALEGAAAEIHATPLNDGVRVALEGPSAWSHNSAGANRRQVLPDDGQIPHGYAEAVDQAFGRAAGGG